MMSERSRGLFAVHTAVQAVAVIVVFWGWLALFKAVYDPPSVDFQRYLVYCGLTVAALLARAALVPPTRRILLHQSVGERLRHALNQTAWAIAFLLLFVVAAKDKTISRVFFFTWFPVLYATLTATNAGLPAILARWLFQGTRLERTLLYILSPEPSEKLNEWIERQESMGLRIVGCVADDAPEGALSKVPVVGGTEEVERALSITGATQLLVTELPMFPNVLRFLARLCEARGIRLLVLSDLDTKFGHTVTMVNEDGLEFFTLRGEPLQNPFNRVLKRIVDIVISLPVVVFVLPVLALVVWVFQRLQSPGPLLYKQPRAGIQNMTFQILKFRTMHTNNGDDARQATTGDDRIYPAGRLFRRLSIDEFPQFINVLRGDMSIVGPRPHLAQHNEKWASVMQGYHVRAFVKPGITGLAQVRGFRGEATTNEAIRLRVLSDIEYIENWSLTLDLLILARTVFQVVRPPKTAY
jgi:exopolysaccharide biosynthesis polyprenyl glycosylphosphotransferase